MTLTPASLALRLSEKPPFCTTTAGESPAPLRSALREVRGSRVVLRALLVAAAVPGFSALDEYLPLLAREKGAGTPVVPLLVALTALAMAAGSALAARRPVRGPALPLALAVALTAVPLLLVSRFAAW